MSKRRIGIVLVVLAAAVLAAVIIIKLVHGKAGKENEEVTADVAVHVGKIQRATLHRYVTAYGSVEPEPAGLGHPPADAQVASPVAGIVARIECVEGQRVAKGTVLFQLDSRLAEVAYEKAKKNLDFAQENFERQKKLLPVEGTSKKSYLEAEQQLNDARSGLAAAETDLALLKIKAPLAGTVVKINTEPGEAVELNTVLAAIVDLDRLVAAVNIPSREAALVKVGQSAQFEIGGKIPGAVVYVGSKIDEKTDTVPVRISLPAGAGFRPGRFLNVRIVCGEHADCLVVPEVAAIADSVGSETGRIVLVEDGKAVWKPVKIGFREGGLVEVTGEGLKEGLVIVTEDAYAVPDETKIHIIQETHE
jgi:membrane fusion protein (multidrug efflux system)